MLNHRGTVAINTERLMLRRFTADDAGSVYKNWAGDGEVCTYMRWHPHRDVEETKGVIKGWVDAYEKKDHYQWAITLKGNDEPIGAIGLFVVNEGDLCMETAYCIGREYWGQGITSEAHAAVVAFAFRELGCNRVESYHSVNNPASGKVMQHAGMVFEGVARQKYRSISGFEDSAMYAILKEDFDRRTKESRV
jgi:ribosomal-protein-alanine N-acetyltransferase